MKCTRYFALSLLAVAGTMALMSSCDMMWDATEDVGPGYSVGAGTNGWNVSVGSGWNSGVYPWGWNNGWNNGYWPMVTTPSWVGPPTRPGGNFRPSPPAMRPPQVNRPVVGPLRPGEGGNRPAANPQPQPTPPTGQRPGAK